MFNDSLSLGAKLIIAYINGKIRETSDGKVELTKETIARLIGTKHGKDGKRSLSQAKRYLRELKKSGIIESKQKHHTQLVWFKNPWGSYMDPIKNPWGSYMTSMVNSTFIEERLKKLQPASPDSFFKHPKLDPIFDSLPPDYRVKKALLNKNLVEHGEPYIDYLLRTSKDKKNPKGYFYKGLHIYFRDYLKSPEHAIAGFKLLGN